MDFDEYDYLEKTVEETNGPSSKSKDSKDSTEKEKEKGYRRKERDEDDGDIDEDEKDRKNSSKKSRGDEENGRERARDRERERDKEKERSSRHRSRERESERSSRDRDKEKREKERDRERRDRDRDRDRDKDKDKDKDKVKGKDKLPANQFDQPTAASERRKHSTESLMQRDHSVERNGHALPPESPRSSSSMEMTPYGPAINPTGALHVKGRFREPSYNLKTSTELVKVLNRIWSLEEQHTSNVALVKAMKKELDHTRSQIKELLQEKKRHHREMDDIMRQLAEDKVIRKHEEDEIQDAIQSMRNEIENERKLRKHSESLHRKLARELSDVKSSYSNALKGLERERKARILLEDLCDEFAKGIKDYEQEIRLRKNKIEKDWIIQEHTDRLILHISEAWLDERMQMKLAETRSGVADKQTIVDKLSLEIETFLQTKKSVSFMNDNVLSSKLPTGNHLHRYSLESFHLNEPGSAPVNGNDEEDYVDSSLYCSELNRGSTQKQSSCTTKKPSENAPIGHLAKIVNSNQIKEEFQTQEDMKDSDLWHPQLQSKEQNSGDVSCNVNETAPVNIEPTQTRLEKPVNLNTTRDPCLSSEGKQHENNDADNYFDPLSFTGPASPVEKWTSKVQALDPEASESSSRHQGIKENTLKAKLLEARLESRQSQSRASKLL